MKIVQQKLILWQWQIKTRSSLVRWMVGSCDSDRVIVITALSPQPWSLLGARKREPWLAQLPKFDDCDKLSMALFSKYFWWRVNVFEYLLVTYTTYQICACDWFNASYNGRLNFFLFTQNDRIYWSHFA